MSQATIYIVSGGNGASGEQLVHTVLAQFPDARVKVSTIAFVNDRAELERIVSRAASEGGTIVHTMVHAGLRRALIALAEQAEVTAIDLMGDLLHELTVVLGAPPVGKPGKYRQLHLDYYERVEAIEYALAHDDGMRPGDLDKADIVLTGPSRVGKTPLSIYLSVLGWRTANVPLVLGIPAPKKLFEINRRRVIGLIVEPQNLLVYRKKRQRELGVKRTRDDYFDANRVFEEIEAAERIFKRGGFTSINATEQALETTANQVIDLIRYRFGDKARKTSR